MKLNIKQRFAVVGIYIALILGIGFYFSPDWKFLIDTNNNLNVVLIVVALSLVFGVYISEPFFTKPIDVISKWITILLFLIGLNSKECFLLYDYWLTASFIFIGFALLLVLFQGNNRFEKQQRIAVDFICKVSRPEIIFSLLYFTVVISFFQHKPIEFPILIGFGFLLAINKPIVWIVEFVSKLFRSVTSKSDLSKFIGQVIGHESTDLYKVEIPIDNPFRQKNLKGELIYLENIKNGVVGIVLSERILLGKKWIEILSLRDNDQNLISFDIKSSLPLTGEKSIFSKTNAVYLLDINALEDEVKNTIETNNVKKNFNNLIGIVWEGSTINKIRFNKLFTDELQKERNIGEGSIIQTEIANEEVLYQIIDGRTDEETLEFKDTHGYTIGTAQKLGQYIINEHELNTVKWLPEIYTPIFLLEASQVEYNANNFIGKLPNTNYGIPIKTPHELVTHNTAILGILGIGKSCLTFELLKKLIDTTDVKIICIDITNEYFKEDKLPRYISKTLIEHDSEGVFSSINSKYEHIEADDKKQFPEKSGNKKEYQNVIKADLLKYFFNQDIIPENLTFDNTKRVKIYNPDYHKVSQGEKIGYNVITSPLTQTEKTRIISEEVFKILMKLPIDPEGKAKVLLVFEEAHSLIPEFNAIANDGDKTATNGTAKVILQGRKYGLGSLVVTQRTANISKSILNQCNTIFALRVFDDTGKQFLENYIGSDYSNLLPTLEERHCIAIGKALKLKQPVILELNHKDSIQIQHNVDAPPLVEE